jgi:hypothetical protein
MYVSPASVSITITAVVHSQTWHGLLSPLADELASIIVGRCRMSEGEEKVMTSWVIRRYNISVIGHLNVESSLVES